MDTRFAFTSKAEKYARYRWDYAPEAIDAIFKTAGLSSHSTVADIGAGTGRLTRHFAGRVEQIAAVEPNRAMLVFAEELLQGTPGCTFIEAPAEATGLPDAFAEIVTIGQAVHWFDPEPARREIRRILKPGGWLTMVWNIPTNAELGKALSSVLTVENGVMPVHLAPSIDTPLAFYFCGEPSQSLSFPFTYRQDWETFLGGHISGSNMPDPDNLRYPAFERGMREVFDQFSIDHDGQQMIEVRGETRVVIGKMGIISECIS